MVVVAVFAIPGVLLASPPDHPKGPDSMPEQSIKGTHKAIFNVPEFPSHIIYCLMVRTGLECRD